MLGSYCSDACKQSLRVKLVLPPQIQKKHRCKMSNMPCKPRELRPLTVDMGDRGVGKAGAPLSAAQLAATLTPVKPSLGRREALRAAGAFLLAITVALGAACMPNHHDAGRS